MTPKEEKEAVENIELAMHRMSPEVKRLVRDYLKKLVHYRDTTVGLWVTDRPKSLDEKRLMFKLKF